MYHRIVIVPKLVGGCIDLVRDSEVYLLFGMARNAISRIPLSSSGGVVNMNKAVEHVGAATVEHAQAFDDARWDSMLATASQMRKKKVTEQRAHLFVLAYILATLYTTCQV